MSQRARKIRSYAKGMWASLRRFRPRHLLNLLSGDDHSIRYTVHGFSMVVNVDDWTIGRSILMKGDYETNVTRALLRLTQPDTRFLDVGANLGWFSLLVASQCPAATVYGFEPDRRIFDLFTASIALNGWRDRIHAHNLAVSDTNEQLIFTDLGNPSNYGARFTGRDRALLESHVHGEQVAWSSIDAVTIDDFLKDQDFDLVKIDIEGFEPYAVRGMWGMITRCRPAFVCEFAPSNIRDLGQTEPGAFLQQFVDIDYTLHVIDADGGLIDCGTDPARVLAYVESQPGHHQDLVLKP